MPLQTEYRPKTFKQVVGNKDTIKAIKSALAEEKHNHCILLSGDSGCGKTTLAYLIAKRLGAYDHKSTRNVCFREFNASDFRGVDMVRGVRQESAKAPLGGDVRVYFFDECHKLTPDAQEAFLKLLEIASETPNYYIFATTNPEALKITFKRRCAQYTLAPVTEEELLEHLKGICEKEEIKATDEVLERIAQDATGSVGVALGILDAIKGLSPSEMLSAAQQQAALQNEVIELCRALANKDSWKKVAAILRGLQGQDAEGIRRKVLGYCSSWLLKQDNARAFLIMDAFETPTYDMGFPRIVHSSYMAVKGDNI